MNLKTLKKTAVAVLISSCLTLSMIPQASAMIKTIDTAAIAKLVDQIAQAKKDFETQKEQLTQLKAQVEALTGSRGLGEFAKNAALDQIPEEWKGVYEKIKGLKSSDLAGKGNYKSGNALDALVNSYKQSSKAVEDTQKRLDVIEQLAKQVDQTKDAKAAADLQNRISIEQSKIANNETMLNMTMKMAEQQRQVQIAQQRQILACQYKAKTKEARKGCGSI